jgi:hypothetical protein
MESPHDRLTFKVWKSVELTSAQDKVIKKVRLHEETLSKDEFVKVFENEFSDLREHIKRTTNQFEQIRKLRDDLRPEHEVTIQLDYAENYSCVHQDEPSQVFYDRRQISVHPMVVHFREAGVICHQSYVGVTDITKHSAPTTIAFLTKLIPEIVKIKPNLNMIHYISDSPVNQYRNKYIVKFVAQHQLYFPGVHATWEFLEAGHGKGPCDGVGGSLKSSLETHVKRGNTITCASDVLGWASNVESALKIIYIRQEDVTLAERKVKNAVFVKGINAMHSIRCGVSYIMMREMSCYEMCCRHSVNVYDHGWELTSIKCSNHVIPEPDVHKVVPDDFVSAEPDLPAQGQQDENLTDVPPIQPELQQPGDQQEISVEEHGATMSSIQDEPDGLQEIKYPVGAYVNVLYNRKTYVGQVIECNEQQEYHINFMKKRKSGYVWPKIKDQMWVFPVDILGTHEFE